MNFKEIIQRKEYDFLRTNPSLGDNICLLVVGGSHAYGMNTETSDVDIRGVALNRPNEIIGFQKFEQFLDKTTDTTIYSFNKIIELLIANNPNIIEMLFTNPKHIIYATPIGQMLIDNRHLFLSQKAFYSFSGFANSQLRRLTNALARGEAYPQVEKEKHIKGTVDEYLLRLPERFKAVTGGEITVTIDDSDKEEFEKEIFCDINLKHFPLRDFNGIMSEITATVRNYDKLDNYNRKNSDLKINKHAAHLIRLYLMGIEILEKGDLTVYREKEHDLLMSIRNGEYMLEDGTYDSSFLTLVDTLEERMKKAKENTTIQKKSNINEIEKLVMDINRKIIIGASDD